MENLDVIILTSIIATAFAVFIVATYREFTHMANNPNHYQRRPDGGPRVALVNFMGRLFSDQKITKKEKKIIYRAMYRNMADMEMDGVYFPEDIKKEIIKQKEEWNCEYSGLPSPKYYETLQNQPK